MRNIIIILLTAFVMNLILWTCVRAQEVITLDKAITIALKYNEDVLSAEKELENSKYVYKEAFSGALPKIDAEATGVRKTYSSNELFDATGYYALSGEINVVQPIWVGGKVGTGLQIANIYKDLSNTAYELEKDKLIVTVKQSFYNVLMAKEALKVIRLVKEDADKNLANIEIMYEQGLVSEYDIIKARVRAKSIEPTVLQYENNLTLAENALKSNLGMDLDKEIQIVGEFSEKLKIDTSNYKTKAVKNSKEIKMLNYQKEMLRKNQRIAFGDYLPTIAAIGQYSFESSNDKIGDMFKKDFNLQKINVGLTLQVPIFHGGETKAKVNQAKIDVKQAELELGKNTRLIELQAEMEYNNLLEAQKEIELQKETVKEAEKSLNIANVRYKNGLGTQLEVIDAQTMVEQAKLGEIAAIHSYINSLINFEYAIGQVSR